MAYGKSTAITYYVGIVNLLFAIIWGGAYVFGFITINSITSPSATPFYIGTLFAVGFGLLYSTVESGQNKEKVKPGVMMSVAALFCYAGLVFVYQLRGGLMFYDMNKQLFG